MYPSKYSISQTASCNLEYASFLATIMILFIHSSLSMMPLPRIVAFTEALIGDGICRVAVPFFFVRSGYLFFLNVDDIKIVVSKIVKRFRSLVVPYLLWGILGLLFLFAVSNIPFCNALIIRQYPWESLKEFCFQFFVNPINYQLWFLRDLFLLCLISPIIFYFVRFTSWAGLVLLFFAYLLVPINYVVLYSSMSLFFFVLGAYIAIREPHLVEYNLVRKLPVVLIVFVILTVYNALSKIYIIPYYSQLNAFLPLLGILCLWGIVQYASQRSKLVLLQYAPLSFFVYLAHEPLLTFLKKILIKYIPLSTLNYELLYFFLPIITLSIVVCIALVIRRSSVSFFSFLVGGR